MKTFCRIFIYVVGMVTLALGLVLTTKANLGVSPILSIPYGISIIGNLNFGAVTAGVYILLVIGQIVVLRSQFQLFQLCQIPLSIVFGMAINLLSNLIQINSTNFLIHLLLLILGILLTGVGVCLTLHMNILPNAADGFVQAVSTQTGKKLGTVKNMLDLTSVFITLLICFLFAGKIIGIGLGTVLAVIGVGRVIAFSNELLHNKLVELAY